VLLLRLLAARHRRDVVALKLHYLGADDILAFWITFETKRKNSVGTRNARLAAIHAFARFLTTRGPQQVEQVQRLMLTAAINIDSGSCARGGWSFRHCSNFCLNSNNSLGIGF
jgi:hypothetical protein